MYTVYWIHNSNETDILTQGYIGCTSNLKHRMQEHKSDVKNKRMERGLVKAVLKQGLHKAIVETILETTCRKTAYAKEFELRPEPMIGWNERAGGLKTIHSEKARTNISKGNTGKPSARKGVKNTLEHVRKMVNTRKANGNYKPSEETKQKIRKATEYEKSHAAVSIIYTDSYGSKRYDCIKRCSIENNLNYSTVRARLRNERTSMIRGWSVEYAPTK